MVDVWVLPQARQGCRQDAYSSAASMLAPLAYCIGQPAAEPCNAHDMACAVIKQILLAAVRPSSPLSF
jgi:hypothetical protein